MIEEVLEEASRRAEEAEVFLVEGESVSVLLKGDRIDTAGLSRSWGMGIRTISDGRIGASGTSDPARWKECLGAALSSGRLGTPQPWGGLPPPSEIPRRAFTSDPETRISVELPAAWVREMLEGAGEHPGRVTEAEAFVGRSRVTIANTRGLCFASDHTIAGVSCEAISGESTGYEFDQSVSPDLDPRRVGERASFLASFSAGAKKLETGEYEVVLSPIAAAHLIGPVLAGALSGKNVHAGRSALAHMLGKECAAAGLQIYDDPFAKGPGATDRDAEGVPTRRVDFIRDGVITGFAYDLRTAYKYGKESTASAVRSGAGGAPAIGVHNLVFDGEGSDVLGGRVLYIHDLVGAHTANPVTGEFSVELSNAYFMEDGTPVEPVRSGMFAGNVFRLLRDLTGVGRRRRVVGSAILPELRFARQRIVVG